MVTVWWLSKHEPLGFERCCRTFSVTRSLNREILQKCFSCLGWSVLITNEVNKRGYQKQRREVYVAYLAYNRYNPVYHSRE